MNQTNNKRVIVQFPDLFVSFLAKPPRINANYAHVGPDSETTVCRACDLRGYVAKAVVLCDFAYFAAVMTPDADEDRFRTICDWGNWIFPFDDIFDNGEFSEDLHSAQAIIGRLLSVFDPESLPTNTVAAADAPIVRFHDDIWARVSTTSPAETAKLYARAMEDYCAGTLDQVQYAGTQHSLDLEEMLLMRRKSVCVATLFALVQYGHEIVLPDFALDDVSIKQIETIGIDLTLMHNDLLSYDKEDAEGVPHNLVAVCRMQGMSAQVAVDCVSELISTRHKQLDMALKQVPSWDERTDLQVRRYLNGIQDVVKANLYWSFRSGRFLTEEQKTSILSDGMIDFRK